MIPEIPYDQLKTHPETGEIVHEEWRDVVGYEGYYQVSNYGRVKSLDRTKLVTRGKGTPFLSKVYSRVLKPDTTEWGYHRVALSKEGRLKGYLVHVLVAKMFIPNPDRKPTVNHENGDKIENFVFNLSWATQTEQIRHAFKNGLIKPRPGETHPKALFTNNEVSIIRDAIKKGFTPSQVGIYFNCNLSTICNIRDNKTYIIDERK